MTAKKKKKKAKTKQRRKPAVQKPQVSAGGIVVRGKKRPLYAVVQLRQQKLWVLPKGKLHKGESEFDAARREAAEETGRNVEAFEYLGQIAYRSENDGEAKVVKFWRMEASGKPRKLMRDIQAVRWLTLEKAIAKLSREREQKFLRRVAARTAGIAAVEEESAPTILDRIRAWISGR